MKRSGAIDPKLLEELALVGPFWQIPKIKWQIVSKRVYHKIQVTYIFICKMYS